MTALPDILRKDGLFCCWRYEERNGKKTKVPYQPVTGLGVKSNDPNSFVSYDVAVQAKGYDGIGLGMELLPSRKPLKTAKRSTRQSKRLPRNFHHWCH